MAEQGSVSPAGGRVWLSWVVASAAGWAAGGAVARVVVPSAEPMVAGFGVVVLGALLAAMLQWLVLKRRLAGAGWWVVATIGGLAAVGVLVFVVELFDAGVGAAVSGPVLGAAQWPVLRRRVAGAGWWVLAATVGWIAGGFLSGAFEPGIAGWITIGVVYGMITGPALVWLLGHPLHDVRDAGRG